MPEVFEDICFPPAIHEISDSCADFFQNNIFLEVFVVSFINIATSPRTNDPYYLICI